MVDNRQHGQHTQPKQMQTSPEESKIEVQESEVELDLATVITDGLREVMYSRNNMQEVERRVSEWMAKQTDHSPTAKTKLMDQMVNAKLGLESLYNRVAMGF